jgi:hypothetical protein
MNMDTPMQWTSNPDGRFAPGKPVDHCGQPFPIRQELRERAQRLYMIGELNLAAQLLLELAAGRRTEAAESESEAING